ncbi:acyloxyacyl hydrolase [Stutzerimonas tarimensis]|uniref:Lipid A deacylase n=1 Tax=Stutzerimonas tarimensis TaxID=1507735 RepID=A0ABV7T3L5_9GAMM
MKRFFPAAALVLLTVGQAGQASAVDVTAAIGQSGESNMTYRLGLQFDFDRSWFETGVGRLTGYWDAGYTYWQGDRDSANHSLSFAPVFVYQFAGEGVRPFIEAGIGVALFERTSLEGNNLSTAFQFEDRFGVGLRFSGGHQLGLRAIHYSNAGIKRPNEGTESYSLFYRVAL